MDAPRMKTKSKFKVKHQKQLSNVSTPVMLLPDDFKANMKVKVDLQYFNQDVLPGHYKFKVYCPLVFRAYRRIFGVSERRWRASFTSSQLVACPNQDRMWLSADKEFFVRGVSGDDVANLHSILSELHKHYIETNAQTLLPHLLGLFRLFVDDKTSYLLVLRNIFSAHATIHEIYDIKGSSVDRFASSRERLLDPPVFKDNDLVSKRRAIHIGERNKHQIIEMLNRDTQFLAKLNIMDYSFIIGIHKADGGGGGEDDDANALGLNSDDDAESSMHTSHDDDSDLDNREMRSNNNNNAIQSSPSSPNKEEYFFGISMLPTFYGTRKKTAHLAKTAKYGPEADISSVKPDQYAKRLLDFVDRTLI